MTLEEQGAYRNLLDEAFLNGGTLAKDERVLAKACGDALRWRAVRGKVLKKFYAAPEGWRNTTLDAVLRESRLRSDKQARYRNRLNGKGNVKSNAIRNAAGNK
jgi:uncharacterized protein YdaU (DUF1376 family)